jgi:DNA topoisomerase I
VPAKTVPAEKEPAETGRATAGAEKAKTGTTTAKKPPAKKTAGGAGTKLVIVESPSKARTIAGYLGNGYVVESSVGHIRDMPDSAADIPAKYKGEAWAKLGVNVDHNFDALYVVHNDKRPQVAKLKSLLKDADELLLATDEDREGEAIAWHLLEELKPKVPYRRMVFHEITPEAISRAIDSPRELDHGLVDAYQARRVLDRLYGYEVSPVLWKKVMPRLSAGRVQSVATRLVVDRERERIAFRAASYWDLEAEFATKATPEDDGTPNAFTATLVTVDGKRVAQGRDFSSTGQLKSADLVHLDADAATALAGRLHEASFTVSSVERKPYRRSPYAPFRTTTLQQEASRKLGLSAKTTMSIAQKLYENGYITYMRTDSVTLSQTAITAARRQATQLYGAEYVPDSPRVYASKVKNAQEAHEAIRPAGDSFRTPAQVARELSRDESRLYELIWQRTVASQMKDATGESVSVRVAGTSTSNERAEFGASGKIINFYGFLKAYVEEADNAEDRDDKERRLPPMAERDPLDVLRLGPAEHSTRPPARYTEASLVKELEDREIGRPSTYATILGTILDRGYVFKKGTALVPSFRAFAVTTLLEQHFGQLVDYEFTAHMEDVLDEIARGEAERVPWLRRFYFGNGQQDDPGLKALVTDIDDIDPRVVNSFPLEDSDIVVRVGRYGPYLERGGEGSGGGEKVNVPDDLAPDELTKEKAEELFSQPNGDYELGTDPTSGHQIVAKNGRFGPYVTEILPEGDPAKGSRVKPRTASLLKSMALNTMTLDDALKVLSLPRTIGELEGEPVTVQQGPFGPYVKRGDDKSTIRSLESEDQLFTLTLAEAKDILAQPKPRGRAARGAAKPPLRELGTDPSSGKQMVIKDGRFGPYVTDGETNASLRKGDDVASITDARAAELLADRRATAPAPRKRAAPAAKAASKTTKTRAATTRKKTGTTTRSESKSS